MTIASTARLTGIRFPGKYVQGPGALTHLAKPGALPGPSPLAVLDTGLFDTLSAEIARLLPGAPLLRHQGECSLQEVARITGLAKSEGAGLIIGIGGGKVLDTVKAVAADLAVPVVVVPTIAASDAPCSALSVIYHPDGTVAHDRFLPRNPDLVLVDTQIIPRAPSRFLAAGIGDALATWYEADACRKSGALNCMALPGASLAYAIAAECREVIFRHGADALAECDRDSAGPALERVVEANILLSGIGFESGGVAAAHAIHHGLCELDDVHPYLHGEKVAIGVLAGLLLADDLAEFQKVRAFCQSVRLPVRLTDIGIVDASADKLWRVAARATRAGEIIHNEPRAITAEAVVAALKQLI